MNATKSVFLSSCCLSSEMTTRGGDDEFGDGSWVACGKCGEPCEAVQYVTEQPDQRLREAGRDLRCPDCGTAASDFPFSHPCVGGFATVGEEDCRATPCLGMRLEDGRCCTCSTLVGPLTAPKDCPAHGRSGRAGVG